MSIMPKPQDTFMRRNYDEYVRRCWDANRAAESYELWLKRGTEKLLAALDGVDDDSAELTRVTESGTESADDVGRTTTDGADLGAEIAALEKALEGYPDDDWAYDWATEYILTPTGRAVARLDEVEMDDVDGHMICAAHNALPRLIARVRSLEAAALNADELSATQARDIANLRAVLKHLGYGKVPDLSMLDLTHVDTASTVEAERDRWRGYALGLRDIADQLGDWLSSEGYNVGDVKERFDALGATIADLSPPPVADSTSPASASTGTRGYAESSGDGARESEGVGGAQLDAGDGGYWADDE